MSARLDVFEEAHYYVVAWVVDGEVGGWLGDLDAYDYDGLTDGAARELRECEVADSAAKPFAKAGSGPPRGYRFETRSDATKALRAARAALKALAAEVKGKPWPDWAKVASAHGWKPPKGWTP